MASPSWLLFCLPCAGGSAAAYMRWRRLMPQQIRVVPLELPGRGSRMREPALREFNALADDLSRQVRAELGRLPSEQIRQTRQSQQSQPLQPLQPLQPQPTRYALFGHSMGGLLAYGIAHRLKLDLIVPQPDMLFLSACAAPTRRDRERFAVSNASSLLGDLKRLGGTQAEVFEHPELLGMTLDLLAADYAVCADFQRAAGPSLTMPLQVYGGRDDELDASCLRAWQEESSGEFHLQWFDGGHFYLHAQQDALLAHMQARMDAPDQIRQIDPACAGVSHAT